MRKRGNDSPADNRFIIETKPRRNLSLKPKSECINEIRTYRNLSMRQNQAKFITKTKPKAEFIRKIQARGNLLLRQKLEIKPKLNDIYY